MVCLFVCGMVECRDNVICPLRPTLTWYLVLVPAMHVNVNVYVNVTLGKTYQFLIACSLRTILIGVTQY